MINDIENEIILTNCSYIQIARNQHRDKHFPFFRLFVYNIKFFN